jgi:formate hydrogenlyase subunit 3/multisubunit Na+/H+ antiporter MnhD subunit
MAVLLIFTMAACGIVLTRDLFNLFVFFELVAIATGGLILLSPDPRALGAGFKYLVASQVITVLLLVGIIFSYHAHRHAEHRRHGRGRAAGAAGRRAGVLPDVHRRRRWS